MAYVLGVPYKKALNSFARPDHAFKRGYYCSEIVDVLKKYGLNYQFSKFKTPHKRYLDVPGTIVFLGRSKKHPIGHFIVRTPDGQWMDPWINLPVIAPAQSGLHEDLPGKPTYVIHPVISE